MIGRTPGKGEDAELMILGLFADEQALPRARDWARGVLDAARIDPARSPLRAMRRLRRVEPRLGPVAARWLVAQAADGPGAAGPPRGRGVPRFLRPGLPSLRR